MKRNKKAIFLVAENCSGKTTIAKILSQNLSAKEYSMREIIRDSAIAEGVDLQNRTEFINFSQGKKVLYGSEFFIKKAVDDFAKSNERYAIIESLRCPGEITWINQNHLYNGIQLIPVAIITPQELRLERFLNRSSGENLSNNENSVEEFVRQETLCNSGVETWEENIKKTILLTFHRFENIDERPDVCANNIAQKIYSS